MSSTLDLGVEWRRGNKVAIIAWWTEVVVQRPGSGGGVEVNHQWVLRWGVDTSNAT
jgi:hypothetical protein